MYKDKVEHKYSSGDLWEAWRGNKSMSSINQINSESDRKPFKIEGINEADLPNTSNDLHSCFGSISLLRETLSSDCNIAIGQECVRDL